MSSLGQLAYTLAWMFAVPTLALLAAFAPVSRRRLTAFGLRRDITVTVGNGPILIGYLARVARWRALGGAAGWIAGGALALPGGCYFWGAAGYLTGALTAEVKTSVRPSPGLRRAALTVRRSRDYLSWGARWGPVLIVTALACQMAIYVRWPNAGLPDVRPARAAADLAAITVLVIVMGLSRRLITQRPRPVLAADLSAADDAIRAGSLQTISGASLALMCLAATDAMWAALLDLDAPEPFNWISTWLSIAMYVFALYSWFGVRGRVRRPRRRAAA
ncbi:hypothetical protein [Microbispora sp. NPDC049125]|uniref:hypothetical protein n=1 Tax=Microbispora sp. NPDC049125 TaxID=3154929 RepID=UPI00346739B9